MNMNRKKGGGGEVELLVIIEDKPRTHEIM
jgi:hypothetical protein